VARFAYEVRDPQGRVLRGEADGPSHLDVVLELRRVGYEILGVWQKPPYLPGTVIWRFFHRVSLEELAVFTRQLSMFFSSGLGLLRGLESIAGQGFSKLTSESATELSRGLREGRGLAASMSLRPVVFSQVYVRMVHAGESSGALDKILARLADFLERDMLLQKRLRASLAYPLLIFIFSVLMVGFLLLFVFPMFVTFFDGLDVELPVVTKSLLSLTNFFRHPAILATFFIVGPVLFYHAYQRMGRSDEAMLLLSRARLKLPLVGPLVHSVLLARFARTLAILLEAGIPQLTALQTSGKAIGNAAVEQAVDRACERIRDDGASLAGALGQEPLFSRAMVSMLSVGEEVGRLPQVLDSAADSLDLTIETSVSRLTVVLEPLMLGVLGIIVGYVLLAVFLPVYALVEAL
jgi:type IV pilus assembly protein PilC